ncbi:MAG: RHS repeat-associated core domain-containing protein [Candidatus Dormibacteria bacterium]
MTTYYYNYDQSLAKLVYPSGRQVKYTVDSAGRPSVAQDASTNAFYAEGSCPNGVGSNGVCYAPQGAVEQIQDGTNLVTTTLYNPRLQPCWIYATTAAPLSLTTSCTGTASAGTILDLKYNFNLGSGDNGNVMGITNNRDTTRGQSFTYDQLNRLLAGETTSTYATSPSHCWGEAYVYDNAATGEYGNLTNINVASSAYNGCTQENLSMTVNGNNQLSGLSYDAAGNVLNDGHNSYLWYSGGSLESANGQSYAYDGRGNRTEKAGVKVYWYGLGSDVLDESDTSGNVTDEYVYFGGKRIAHISEPSGTVYYYVQDHLGTSRAMVQAGQTTPCYDADFYPYGGERAYTNTCSQNYKFTGKERDAESGLDDFGARYYSSSMGRFMSSDWSAVPVPVPYANLTNPQTLNLYAMAHDNPESFADLDGHASTGDDIKAEEELYDWMATDPADNYPGIVPRRLFGTPGLPDEDAFDAPFAFDFEFQGHLYGKYYDQTFSAWDEYADWATGIAALPESRVYSAYQLIASNQGINPNTVVQVGYQNGDMVYSVWVPDLIDQSVNRATAASDGGWQDPLTSFHGGAASWYFGNLFGFDVGHLVDSIDTSSGEVPINAHIDPFGPFNPFHYLIQLPSMLFPSAQPGAASCAINGGCSIN